jgi:hypothetical protein
MGAVRGGTFSNLPTCAYARAPVFVKGWENSPSHRPLRPPVGSNRSSWDLEIIFYLLQFDAAYPILSPNAATE